jgi:DNA-binding MarR family transcriptional regulator
MERDELIYRAPHPTHGRILEIYATEEGLRRFKAARPFIRRLEATMCEGFDATELATVKRWLVHSARSLSTTPARQPTAAPQPARVRSRK